MNPAKLKALRKARGWSQMRLALEAGVDTQTVLNYERGHPQSVYILEKLAEAFGMKLVVRFEEAS